MKDLLKEFKQNWEQYRFGEPGQTFLVTVSGGVDSMVLAELFLRSKISFGVAHCNFQLRGAEADADEQFVTDWCNRNDIKLHKIRFETAAFSLEWKKGTQETARILRYEWFEQIRQEFKYNKIVTAHHANDNVETMLINLFKGTGIAGIHGILPVSGHIIRPLLFAQKDELAAWASTNGITNREDASNATDDYLRNAVRRNIIPVIEEWFPGGVARANESITRFGEAEVLYKKAIGLEKKKLIELRGKDFYIPVLKLKKCHPLATILYELIVPYGFSSAQVPHVVQLIDAESGHFMNSSTHRIIKNRDFLVITTLPAETAGLIMIESAPATIDTEHFTFNFSIQDKPAQISTDKNIAILDMKNIEFPLLLRKWKTGDYFYPLGMGMKKKKVSRVLINEKIALHNKENIYVVESNHRILWLAGLRPDERFKIKETTEKVMVVRVEKK